MPRFTPDSLNDLEIRFLACDWDHVLSDGSIPPYDQDSSDPVVLVLRKREPHTTRIYRIIFYAGGHWGLLRASSDIRPVLFDDLCVQEAYSLMSPLWAAPPVLQPDPQADENPAANLVFTAAQEMAALHTLPPRTNMQMLKLAIAVVSSGLGWVPVPDTARTPFQRRAEHRYFRRGVSLGEPARAFTAWEYLTLCSTGSPFFIQSDTPLDGLTPSQIKTGALLWSLLAAIMSDQMTDDVLPTLAAPATIPVSDILPPPTIETIDIPNTVGPSHVTIDDEYGDLPVGTGTEPYPPALIADRPDVIPTVRPFTAEQCAAYIDQLNELCGPESATRNPDGTISISPTVGFTAYQNLRVSDRIRAWNTVLYGGARIGDGTGDGP